MRRKQLFFRLALALAVVMPLLFSGWKRLVDLDFGKDKERFIEWVQEADAPAIQPTLNLFREAKKMGLKVFFITGRRTELTAPTLRNLERIGYEGIDKVYFRPESD